MTETDGHQHDPEIGEIPSYQLQFSDHVENVSGDGVSVGEAFDHALGVMEGDLHQLSAVAGVVRLVIFAEQPKVVHEVVDENQRVVKNQEGD